MRTVIIRCQFRPCSDCQPVVVFGISRLKKQQPITPVFANQIQNATQKKCDVSDFYTCISVQMLRALKSNFKVSFAPLDMTHNNNFKLAEQSGATEICTVT